jgi:hypothetical protein
MEPPGPESFTPLSVRDKTQIVFMMDSSTTSLEIVNKVERADGHTVYKDHERNKINLIIFLSALCGLRC